MEEGLRALSLLPLTGRRGQSWRPSMLLNEAMMSSRDLRHSFVGSSAMGTLHENRTIIPVFTGSRSFWMQKIGQPLQIWYQTTTKL